MGTDNGTTAPLPFRKFMDLEDVSISASGLRTFRSITPAWAPGAGTTAFGGHVYAQAAWAASRTVEKGMAIHNMTGFFVLPGRTDVPFTYHVRKVRDGGVYSLRSVDVYQKDAKELLRPTARNEEGKLDSKRKATERTPCFIATVSFKRREDNAKFADFKYQTPQPSAEHLRKAYSFVFKDKKPEDHPIAPGADALWWTRDLDADALIEAHAMFPGLDMRKVNMSSHNAGLGNSDQAGAWRQLSLYRLLKDEREENDCAILDQTSKTNLHACAHLYASDRNSLFVIPHALGYADQVVSMSSLSHTVIFHGDPSKLQMCDDRDRPTWFVQEAWTENGGLNRGCHESRLWRLNDDGIDEIIATTKQDGMIRVPRESRSLRESHDKKERRIGKLNKGKL